MYFWVLSSATLWFDIVFLLMMSLNEAFRLEIEKKILQVSKIRHSIFIWLTLVIFWKSPYFDQRMTHVVTNLAHRSLLISILQPDDLKCLVVHSFIFWHKSHQILSHCSLLRLIIQSDDLKCLIVQSFICCSFVNWHIFLGNDVLA